MSSLDFELDARMNDLEFEWRSLHELSIIARAECLALCANPQANAVSIEAARERLRRAEATEARLYARIELLENDLLGLS